MLNGTVGRLAIKGPHRLPLSGRRAPAALRPARAGTCRSDTFLRDDDGYFFYQARNDDMIISAGYNIAGPEVEDALLRCGRWPSAGCGRAGRRPGQLVKGLCGAQARLRAGRRAGRAALRGLRQGRHRAITSIRAPSSSSMRCRAPDGQAAAFRCAAWRRRVEVAQAVRQRGGGAVPALRPGRHRVLPALFRG